MTVLKISVVLMIVSCLIVTNADDDQLEENNTDDTFALIAEFQSTYKDRGHIARRDINKAELMKKSSNIIDNYVSSLETELDCSFVFSALVHVYLTNVDSTEQKMLTFTKEAAYMIDYAFVRKKSKLLEVMWLVYLCNTQTDELIESVGIGQAGDNFKNILLTSNAALEKVLEEFTESYECKVYDRETCEVQEVKYVDKIKEVMREQTTGVPLTLKSNKERFLIQQSNILSAFISKENSGIGLEQLRLSHLMMDTDTVNDLIKTFGVQVDSGPIVEHLLKCYKETYNVNVPLHDYIDSFITLQSDVITTFKAMALRIVIVYLMSMQQYLESCSIFKQIYYLVGPYRNYNQKMITLLTDFASLVGQPDDQYLENVIQIFNSFYLICFENSWFDDKISSVFSLLEDMTLNNRVLSTFSNQFMVNELGFMVNFDDIVKKYNVVYLNEYDLVQQIIVVNDIYMKLTKKINQDFDFGSYNSIACLKESDYYKRLVELETNGKNENILS